MASVHEKHQNLYYYWGKYLSVYRDTILAPSLWKRENYMFFLIYIACWIFCTLKGNMIHIIFIHISLVYSSLKYIKSFRFVHIMLFSVLMKCFVLKKWLLQKENNFVLRWFFCINGYIYTQLQIMKNNKIISNSTTKGCRDKTVPISASFTHWTILLDC